MMKLLGADKLCRDRILWWVMLVVIPFLISGCTGGGGSQVYSIAGHVVSSDGSGLSGLPVTAGSFSTVTDQNGNFTFTGIKGTVLVLVENPHSLVVPTFRTVSSTTNSATFTVHSLLATGSDVEIPDHGFAAFESGIILDFRQTLLAGDGMVSVHIVDSPQDCAGMDIAGAVVDIDISEPLGVDESVELSILPDSGTSIGDHRYLSQR